MVYRGGGVEVWGGWEEGGGGMEGWEDGRVRGCGMWGDGC